MKRRNSTIRNILPVFASLVITRLHSLELEFRLSLFVLSTLRRLLGLLNPERLLFFMNLDSLDGPRDFSNLIFLSIDLLRKLQ